MKVSELIAGALRLMGRLGPGRTAGPSEQAAAFDSLNGMLDEWATKRLMVYQTIKATYSLAGGQQTYEIGPTAADFVAARPARIETAAIIAGNVRFPMRVVTADEYSRTILETTLTGQVPSVLWDDMAAPNSMLYLWPIPNGASTLELFTWQPITAFNTVDDPVAMPPGFLESLRYNLAMRFASEVGKQVPAPVAAVAAESIRQIERLNKLILSSREQQAAEIDAIESADIVGQNQPV